MGKLIRKSCRYSSNSKLSDSQISRKHIYNLIHISKRSFGKWKFHERKKHIQFTLLSILYRILLHVFHFFINKNLPKNLSTTILFCHQKNFLYKKKSFMKRIQVNLINRINIFDLIYIIKIHNILCM